MTISKFSHLSRILTLQFWFWFFYIFLTCFNSNILPSVNAQVSVVPTENSTVAPSVSFTEGDFIWVLICGFIIFTMQTGFGLLEGGFTYWILGYGITYGTWEGSSPYFGIGDYVVDSPKIGPMGDLFTSFFFQLSFATTATTIASGAMAERCNFKAYCLYSLFATITYSVQARWVWGPTGFLGDLGVIDIAGSGSVHLVGGTAGFVGAWMLGPRLGRYGYGSESPVPGNHMNVLLGLFNLWWGWFAFNAGSTYGVTADKWKFAARAATTTVVASIGGGLVGLIWGFLKRRKPFGVVDLVNAILGALVGITAGCAIFHTPEAFLTGVIGALVALLSSYIPDFLKVDDPVGATAVHGFGGIWGMLAVGFFAQDDEDILGITKGQVGLIWGGSGYLLLVQTIAICCIIGWSLISTFIILWVINLVTPLRVAPHEELIGLDFYEHGIRRHGIGISPAVSLFGSLQNVQNISQNYGITGQDNTAHIKVTAALRDIRHQRTKRVNHKGKSTTNAVKPNRRKLKMKSIVMFARAAKRIEARINQVHPTYIDYYLDLELGKL